MLKWTKLHREADKIDSDDNSKADKNSNNYAEDFVAIELTENQAYDKQQRQQEKNSLYLSSERNQNHTKSKTIHGNITPNDVLSETGAYSLTKRFDSSSLALCHTSLQLLSMSVFPTVCSDIVETASVTKSQLQIETKKGGNMSHTSSFSHESVPTSTSESSSSLQLQPTTSFTTSDPETAEGPENEASPNLTPPSQQKNVHAVTSSLPDIARSVPITEREVLGPSVEWEQENLTMEEIADIDNFPCVCFFEEHVMEQHGQREFLSAGLKIYSRQPVLLHMATRKKQARARTIFKDPRGAYYEVGQTMIIPDDYQGWFELVPSDFSRAACFMSIDEVAKAMPRKFFTRSNIKGIRIEGEGEQQKYLERKITAGSVLETKGTFTAKWRTRAETGLFKRKTTEWELQEVTYLKCLDRDQQEVLIPVTHKGKFNAIYDRGQLNQNAVYSMKDILSDLSLPIKVRLLFGKAPVVPCIFTGMLVVRSACVDEAIVGSTILNTRNVLFEISVKAPVKVKYISKDEPFAEMSTYKDAQKLCKKYANLFSTMIKLSPDLDTDQKVIMHVPSDPSVMRQVDESLRALDLITDISFTDTPKNYLLDSSDSGSLNSDDQMVIPKGGTLEDLEELKGRESHTHV